MKDNYGQEVVVGNYVAHCAMNRSVAFGIVTRVGKASARWKGSITVASPSGPLVRRDFVIVPRLAIPAHTLQQIHEALGKMKTKGESVAVIDPILAVAEDALRSKE